MTATEKKQNQTKRCHYIPEVYSKNFCVDGAKPIFAYRYDKTSPDNLPIRMHPDRFGVESNYYAFEKEDGTYNTKLLEDLFHCGENDWPNLIEVFEKSLKPYPEHIDNLCTFLAMMRVRVPNFRMQQEENHAEMAKTKGMLVSRYDKKQNESIHKKIAEALASGDVEEANSLIKLKKQFDQGEFRISVNPEVSLRSVEMINTFHDHFMELNWLVLNTDSEHDFITTDNPVVYYDAATLRDGFVPYKNGLAIKSVEVIFPLTKKLILIGNRFFPDKLRYGIIPKSQKSKVKMLNRRFVIAAEKYIYSNQPHLINLVKNYCDVVPRWKYKRIPKEKGR